MMLAPLWQNLLQKLSSRVGGWADGLPRAAKITILVAVDFSVFTALALLAFGARAITGLDVTSPRLVLLLAAAPSTCACLFAFGAYGNIVRFHAPSVEAGYVVSIIVGTLVWACLIYAGWVGSFPRSVLILYCGLAIIFCLFIRRSLAAFLRGLGRRGSLARKQIAIIGINDFAVALAQSLGREIGVPPKCFVDLDGKDVGRRINGLPIYSMESAHEMARQGKIDAVILALPQSTRRANRGLIDELAQLPVQILTIAPPADILSGRVSITDLRPIDISDVLGRDQVEPDRALMERAVAGKSVLVSGAGGSIGSELVRQILGFRPKSVVLLELSEIALYDAQREVEGLVDPTTSTEFVYALGDASDERLMRRLLQRHSVEAVFHAAAYKHVPLGERNMASCLRNNIQSTRVLAECSAEAGVGLFVLVSTDKAVRPTNVMGASKRVAELVLQDLATRAGATTFTMVRFGNVLGSSGSVIPLFRAQIAAGGPITVTDRRMTRYFMTIPEAVELVLQAAGMARGGDVFVLDMGEPVRIDSLARTMISLSNLTVKDAANPDGDVEIVYTGVREGEKLFEELTIGENVVETQHPRIMKCTEALVDHELLISKLDELMQAVDHDDEAAMRALLAELVEGFSETASPDLRAGDASSADAA